MAGSEKPLEDNMLLGRLESVVTMQQNRRVSVRVLFRADGEGLRTMTANVAGRALKKMVRPSRRQARLRSFTLRVVRRPTMRI